MTSAKFQSVSRPLLVLGLIVVGAVVGSWWYGKNAPTIPLSPPDTTRSYYEPLVPLMLADVPVWASVADTTETRQLGLSRTTVLPADIVKLFVFPSEDFWSFWMKEMSYSIDIIWLDATGKIVHIEEWVSPETYPKSFVPLARALYVIETNAGFVTEQGMQVGDSIDIPQNID